MNDFGPMIENNQIGNDLTKISLRIAWHMFLLESNYSTESD